MNNYLKNWKKNRDILNKNFIYNESDEHSSCGVGLIASLNGEENREIVEMGVAALKCLYHRGAVDADGKTGDGAGIQLSIPKEFFAELIERTGQTPNEFPFAVGMIFLPRTDFVAQEKSRTIVESEILKEGFKIYGWRNVPINSLIIGEKAKATRPEIEQILIYNDKYKNEIEFDTKLFIIRKRIEKKIKKQNINNFYICSLSSQSIVYKGMFLAEQLSNFYPDIQNKNFISKFSIYHQRYSTNTFPTWSLAQPFRVIAHNGEINTLKGNKNWMTAHEPRLFHKNFEDCINDLKPIIDEDASDSAALDATIELLVQSNKSLPMAKILTIPEPWAHRRDFSQKLKNLYAYATAIMESWDGPAAICGTKDDWAIAGMDRNGLRPLRYTLTNKYLITGSEAGMVEVKESEVVEKGRVGPGQMIAVNFKDKKFYKDSEIKKYLADLKPFGKWTKKITHIDKLVESVDEEFRDIESQQLRNRMASFAWTMEDIEMILHPMIVDKKEATGSMGDDAPLAVLSDNYRGLHHFFRQNFSQVTNPPVDSLRERVVMTLRTRIGNLSNILDENEDQCEHLQLNSPILSINQFKTMRQYMKDSVKIIDTTMDIKNIDNSFEKTLYSINQKAEQAVREGYTHIILTDKELSKDRVALPMILVTSSIHSYLIKKNLRTFVSLNIQSAECLDVHYYAVLIGVGATSVNAYMAQQAIADRHKKGLFKNLTYEQCVERYINSINNGLLKIMSKMGISVINSYRGGCNFEAIGLSRNLMNKYFPSMRSKISGIGLNGIEKKSLEAHLKAYQENLLHLQIGGFYRYRFGGEQHAFEAQSIHMLQSSVGKNKYSLFKRYSSMINELPPINIRDLLNYRSKREKVRIDSVQSFNEIRKRLVAPGISLGALSPEAHETLTIAMNRIGAKSDSGEGGEDPTRFTLKSNGDNASSRIKQIASGRFGVTAEYLNNCDEIEIKIAQGAKPGEGGQLPGGKVTDLIAKLRHSTKGVTLISPPPHHDIYSIEDLAQLIYDLKQINPKARVCVKLVAQSGIGTVAAGVAKAKADTILISGHSGGTGASPQSSIKFAGLPWELGLSEVHQVLSLNNLRDKVILRTDGGLKTGRDVVIAAMLGAEEYGIGTASLVAMGCIMVRQCHSNTCPVGVCSQDEKLREKFNGTPEKVINLFSFIAEEVREILTELGFTSLDEIVGRADLLYQINRGSSDLDDLDLNPIIQTIDSSIGKYEEKRNDINKVSDSLDKKILYDSMSLFEKNEKIKLNYTIQNTDRAIGALFASEVTTKIGNNKLKEDQVKINLNGSAGQSLGAFIVKGMTIKVFGDANDYVGKGLSGGKIIIQPNQTSKLITNDNVIIGNTVLYGATEGKLYAAGIAGDRFCVRNSGAEAVVEGCGDNGCEYMTGGSVVILGKVGNNFGAGMTGGMAFVYDKEGSLPLRINLEDVFYQQQMTDYWQQKLFDQIKLYFLETNSQHAKHILDNWENEKLLFWQIIPHEMIYKFGQPVLVEEVKTA
ncbi:MAG: glutamate synthase large subunit [Pelagibacteraceae bacterium]|nr:glutamate synthase large subunit [Pelagibacteraceae bacterium]|tara:strand:+ start:17958 stop:22472 length:4515 start_codon:yes stop_codon:yes gene_type:complete